MFPKKTITEQREQILKTIIPELLPTKLKALGINPPKAEQNLLWLIENQNSNFEFLDGVQGRFSKIYKAGVQKQVDFQGQEFNTEANEAEYNLEISKQLLEHLLLHKQLDVETLSKLATALYLAGYYSGAHDYKTNTEKYTDDGFIATVIHPQKAGKAKSRKTIQVKSLCMLIDEELTNELTDVYYSDEVLFNSLAEVLRDFALAKNHSATIEQLKGFTNRYPEYSTIKFWFNDRPDRSKRSKTNHDKVTKNRLVEEIKKRFPHSRIKKLIS
ncbi:hypothetical protein JYB87_01510 [Shewanella avicenniae]|uniref:Uncharacterized protein n=1 Tax=Shewanella avicenniae TaxID=2814294 RepID=A0ABX7QSR1_9GAMM|nr:hypothetical protein [Shewanella avicenniae]QSX33960.1 hypothetical protein JYB87_01510 [Shewanella avicenniae]